ncbi:MAG: hypothetical protein ACLQVD_10820 [Capsulimonadaceae bacterium]
MIKKTERSTSSGSPVGRLIEGAGSLRAREEAYASIMATLRPTRAPTKMPESGG